jgi:prepilin-type processing-associated H-X9-DG protein
MPGNRRRMYAWADPDCVTNGLSGPNGATPAATLPANSPQHRAGINRYASPIGGPAECPWSRNNCGPNDEPFSFHQGGLNVVLGDGSVRFVRDSINPVVLKYLSSPDDGLSGTPAGSFGGVTALSFD